mmetsp:Transcript_27648/g.40790  ORF Transcript_27648/g.40790 Transcript_27648/m.40790 type:complete len:80 (+) Transcript_27648:486-725(+)
MGDALTILFRCDQETVLWQSDEVKSIPRHSMFHFEYTMYVYLSNKALWMMLMKKSLWYPVQLMVGKEYQLLISPLANVA